MNIGELTLKQGFDYACYVLAIAFLLDWFLPIGKINGLILAVLLFGVAYTRLMQNDGKRGTTAIGRKQQEKVGKSD